MKKDSVHDSYVKRFALFKECLKLLAQKKEIRDCNFGFVFLFFKERIELEVALDGVASGVDIAKFAGTLIVRVDMVILINDVLVLLKLKADGFLQHFIRVFIKLNKFH